MFKLAIKALATTLSLAALAAQPAMAQAARPAPAKPAAAKEAPPKDLTKFPPTVAAPGGPLTLTGWGTRRRIGFQVYHVALYVQQKSANPADYLTLARPARLVLHFARELENEQFTRILLAALKERVNMQDSPTMVDSMLKFSEVFSSVPLFKVGDEVTVTFTPGGRIEFAINGDGKGFTPLTELPLARGLLSIFIGAKPIDADLKRDILEGGPKPREAAGAQSGSGI